MLSQGDFSALILSLQLAALSTLILLVIGTPLAWWLARSQRRWKIIIEACIALPLILPPTVLGFYLLIALGSRGPFGALAQSTGYGSLAFSFVGLVIGSVIYSMPFVVQPLQNSFSALGNQPLEVAATLRASPIDRFLTIIVPMARSGFITASVLGFAHTLGEFGIVLMIGGNIPDETRVVSIAIYDHVEALEYSQAHWLSAGLLILSFIMLISVYAINRQFSMVQK